MSDHHSDREEQLQLRIAPIRERLLAHPLYGQLTEAGNIRTFMTAHVFAVWDFQCLLKSLQRLVTCVEVPWLPTDDPGSRRLLNEIVLDEESDEAPEGGYISHFELYVRAMRECGADTAPIEELIRHLRDGWTVDDALEASSVPPGVTSFVRTTMQIAGSGQVHRIAAAFAYGREEILPAIFQQLVRPLADLEPAAWRTLLSYLDRHIHTDGNRHGPLSRALVRKLCGSDERKWEEAIETAQMALEARERFWSKIASAVRCTASAV
jgi:hypothetical protein